MALEVVSEYDWRIESNCAGLGSELFEFGFGANVQYAKQVCGACAVRLECLWFALETADQEHVLGGHTPRERRKFAGLTLDQIVQLEFANQDRTIIDIY